VTRGIGDSPSPQPDSEVGYRGHATLRRLDHIAVAVRDADDALEHFSGRLGLPVVHTETLESPPVTLTYLDAGNTYIQLVSPYAECDLARWLEAHGEGLHHVCFAVDDVDGAVEALSRPGLERAPASTGRGKRAAFVADGSPHGFILECMQFDSTEGSVPERSADPDD
jgi:methylmalonyl-CoA/ethylmalonyl-CoA epimerase